MNRPRIFNGEVLSNEETGRGELGYLRLHFEHFEKLGISQTFDLQKQFFLIEYFILQFFQNANAGCYYSKTNKSRKKVVNPYYSLGLMHACIMIFEQCTKLKLPWVGKRGRGGQQKMWTSGVCRGGGDASALVPPPTGLMKFINGKDNGNGPYFPSATRNNTSTNKAVTGVALILPPCPRFLSISAPFYGYFKLLKATQKRNKSKQRFEVTPRNCIRKLTSSNPLCYTLVRLSEKNVQRQ